MINPEFSKNLWLEITQHRLIATPVVIALGIVLLFVASDDYSELGRVFDQTLYFGALGFLCIGGAYSTVQNMMNEIVGNTWDQQRMSPLSPWALTWGKILGGAAFMWYGGLVLLALFFLLPLWLEDVWPLLLRLELSVLLIGLALLCQAGFLLMVLGLTKAPERLLRLRRNYAVAAAFISAFIGMNLLVVVNDGGIGKVITWWGVEFEWVDFWLLSSGCFAAWAVWGAYLSMRQQMQFVNGQWSWIWFNLFLMGYLAGFPFFEHSNFEPLQKTLLVAYIVVLGLVYLMLVSRPLGGSEMQLLFDAIYQKRARGVWRQLPLWGVSLLLLGMVTVVYGLCSFEHGEGIASGLMLASVLCFAIRDAGLFLWFTMGKRPERAVVTALVYLVVLYAVAPSIFDFMGIEFLLGIFWPSFDGEVFLIPVVVEVLVMAVLVRMRSTQVFILPAVGV